LPGGIGYPPGRSEGFRIHCSCISSPLSRLCLAQRNFEIHTEYNFFNPAVPGDQFFHFDTFFGGVAVETDIFNITDGGSIAARALSPTQLQVVLNDMTANAGGPYVFNSSNLSLNLNGSSTGGSGFTQDFDWTGPGGALANSPGPNIAFGLAESGLVDTTDTDTIDLVVTENFTEFASAASTANVSYLNAAPTVSGAGGITEVDLSITFGATAADDDTLANPLVPGFETVDLEFLYLGTPFLVGAGNVDLATLLGIFGAPGIYSVEARATDFAGLQNSQFFDIQVGEPACAVPGNPVANCSFQSGFTSWITKDMALPFIPLTVSPAGTSITGFVPWLTAPTDGVSSATHGFDGAGPDTIEVSQDVVIPATGAQLTFDYRAGWDLVTYCGACSLARTFSVVVEPSGGGAPLQTFTILTVLPLTATPDTGILSGNVDLSAFGGQAVRLKFEWNVPESSTGPAAFEIDNIVIASSAAVPSMHTWGRLAVVVIVATSGIWMLGTAAAGGRASRRRGRARRPRAKWSG
jgi:hypothetical protein